MTPEQMRIAAAMSVGWRRNGTTKGVAGDGHLYQKPGEMTFVTSVLLPAYDTDRAAMHELEMSLTNYVLRDSYIRYLCVVIGLPNPLESNPLEHWWYVKIAAPVVCLEAYLRTVGLYKD
jgi:hypothetical protein